MDMVGHEHIGENGEVVLSRGLVDPARKENTYPFVEEVSSTAQRSSENLPLCSTTRGACA